MVEHLVCNQAVVGSNPVASTMESGTMERRAGSRTWGVGKVIRYKKHPRDASDL